MRYSLDGAHTVRMTTMTTTCEGRWSSFPITYENVPGEWEPWKRFTVTLQRCSGCDDVLAIARDEYNGRQSHYTLRNAKDFGGLSETTARFAVANMEALGEL